MKITKLLIQVFVLSWFVALAACSKTQATKNDAGFLPDYSRMTVNEKHKDTRMWVDPKISEQGYDSIILTPVVIKLSPELVEKTGAPEPDLLNEITDYMDQALLREFSKQWKVVKKSGKSALRYNVALTGIDTAGGFDKWYDYVPLKAVVNVASADVSTYAFVFMEGYYSDSMTGHVYAEAARAIPGKKESDLIDVNLSDLKPVIDKWAMQAAEASKEAVSK